MKINLVRIILSKQILGMIILLCLSTIACGISFGDQKQEAARLAETRTALEHTQATLDALLATIDEPDSQVQPTIPPEIIDTEPALIEQQPTDPAPPLTPGFTFQGVSLSYDESVLSGISARVIEAQNMGEDMMPEFSYPAHITFEFENYIVSDHYFKPSIWVFPVEDYENMSEVAASTIASLSTALLEQPSGGKFVDMPSMPLWGAAQFFSAQVRYFEFVNGFGMRYLAMFGQDAYPPNNQQLLYIFQGITYDGKNYLSAVFPITHPDIPDDGDIEITDWDTYFDNWDVLLDDVFNILDTADPNSFTPTLTALDTIMASFLIEQY